MSVLGVLGLGASVAGNILSGIKSGEIARQQQENLNAEKAYSDNLFNKEYYQGVLDRSENKAMLRRLDEKAKEDRERSARTAAITGATPEAQAVQQKQSASVYGDAVTRMASVASQRKDQALAAYNNRRMMLFNAQNNVDEGRKQDWKTFAQNANNLGIAAASSFETPDVVSTSSSSVTKPDFLKASKVVNENPNLV